MLDNVTFWPVFIIGGHRSGTTLLHKLLAATGSFNFVRSYHILNYNKILYNHLYGRTEAAKAELAARLVAADVMDRTFDRVRVHPDLPEEYSFILKRGYSMLYLPSTDDATLARLVELCRKVQVEAGAARPLLLKNPWDSANFLYLRQAFPQARFVFIHRHPLPWVNSRLRVMRQILEERADYSALLDPAYARLHDRPWLAHLARYLFTSIGGLDLRLVTRMTKQLTKNYLENISGLAESDYVEITYEQLCNQPDKTISKVLAFLELEPQAPLDFSADIERRPLNFLPVIERNKEYIQHQLRPYMVQLNYPSL